jgi:hypothetical protein
MDNVLKKAESGIHFFLAVFALSFTLFRLLNLTADFPHEINNFSADLLTDEGWYSNAAVQSHHGELDSAW